MSARPAPPLPATVLITGANGFIARALAAQRFSPIYIDNQIDGVVLALGSKDAAGQIRSSPLSAVTAPAAAVGGGVGRS